MQWSGTPLEGEAVVFVPPLCLPLEGFNWHVMSPAGRTMQSLIVKGFKTPENLSFLHTGMQCQAHTQSLTRQLRAGVTGS